MTTLVVRGGHAADGTPLALVITDGRIVQLGAAAPGADGREYDATGLTVLPGLIDLQVNGVAGIDITATPERLWDVAAALPRHGVTAFVPTVITSAPDARERALATLRAGPPPGWSGAHPLGLHFEGPMIAAGRRGAHPERWLRAPAPELVAGWSRAGGVAMVTIAPELPGALAVIAELAARGVVVAIGHTAARAEEVVAAADHGARMVTHLGNAMPPLAGRAPGAVGAALGLPRLVAGVIADGQHLHPATLAAYWRALGPGRFLPVTDCTAALGLPDGPARLGEQRVWVVDGTPRLADGTLAGSGASLPACLRVLRAATGASLAEVVTGCTAGAARLLGSPDRGRLAVGARGDLTLVDADLNVIATVIDGRVHEGVR
ncbi:MAG: N-acetylglucosamine-6-phosphate deacetylase [Frankia sp.]|nr:N-acetylglucosamine-6-phosphate deacetylase [Frankia sp.]